MMRDTPEPLGWETFRNEECGFTIFYPEDWEVDDSVVFEESAVQIFDNVGYTFGDDKEVQTVSQIFVDISAGIGLEFFKTVERKIF